MVVAAVAWIATLAALVSMLAVSSEHKIEGVFAALVTLAFLVSGLVLSVGALA